MNTEIHILAFMVRQTTPSNWPESFFETDFRRGSLEHHHSQESPPYDRWDYVVCFTIDAHSPNVPQTPILVSQESLQ